MDKETMVEELRRVASSLESEYLSRSMFQRHATISSGAVERVFGSWNEGILAAGLKPLPPGGIPKSDLRRLERITDPSTTSLEGGRISDEELLEDLRRLARELGRRPSGNQIAAKGKYDPTVYKRRWVSSRQPTKQLTRTPIRRPVVVLLESKWWYESERAIHMWMAFESKMEPASGFEPETCCLRNSCSTAELRRHAFPLA